MSEREIDEYVASGEPMDKAGGYAIQGLASKFIERIDGCYFNVVGLPVAMLYRYLRNALHRGDAEVAEISAENTKTSSTKGSPK